MGLYRHQSACYGSSSYGFSPNTVFIPKNSTNGTMEFDIDGIYRSYIVENGKVEAFQKIVDEAGYSGLFVYYDQGYAQTKSGLDAYEEVSSRALYVGIGAYCVILMLFVILFPVRQRDILSTMRSLGADRKKRIAHVTFSSLGLLIPGSLLGWAAASLLWENVTAELMKSVEANISLISDHTSLMSTAIVQLPATLVVIFISALTMTKETGGTK